MHSDSPPSRIGFSAEDGGRCGESGGRNCPGGVGRRADPSEASDLSDLVANYAKAIEISDLEARFSPGSGGQP